MTESYILYLQTDLPVEAVLERIFAPKSISPLEGTNMLYARGNVYLAHAQPLPPAMQDRYENQFGFAPTISIRYFPDGVSSVTTAMNTLADGIVRWLHDGEENVLLSANNKVDVLKRVGNQLQVKANHSFWSPERLQQLDLTYDEVE
ncbi:MAG: SitI3 family protein [Chloroflexota bacterium]